MNIFSEGKRFRQPSLGTEEQDREPAPDARHSREGGGLMCSHYVDWGGILCKIQRRRQIPVPALLASMRAPGLEADSCARALTQGYRGERITSGQRVRQTEPGLVAGRDHVPSGEEHR